MSRKSRARGGSSPSAWAITLVAILAVATGVLAVAAMGHAQSDPVSAPRETTGPTPSGTSTPSDTPTPTPVAELVEASLPPLTRAQERFLLVDASGALWRATAGSCANGVAPLVERSNYGGTRWNDVTPHDLGITQVAALLPFLAGEAKLVATAHTACAAQGFRTFTEGVFWEQSPDALTGASYLPPAEPSAIVSPVGTPPAPCAEPTSLSVDDDVAALVCAAQPYVWTATAASEWVAVAAAPARAVLVSNGVVTVAHALADCEGVAISAAAGVNLAAIQVTGCAPGLDASSAAALAADPTGGVVLWSGDTLIRLG